MAKIIINIRDDIKSNTGSCTEEIYSAIQNGVLLPTNATNGDVIKALFPNAHDWIVRNTIEGDAQGEDEVSHFLELPNNLIINRFTEDWWNAPYEGEVNEN